jgi:hypothetical protein
MATCARSSPKSLPWPAPSPTCSPRLGEGGPISSSAGSRTWCAGAPATSPPEDYDPVQGPGRSTTFASCPWTRSSASRITSSLRPSRRCFRGRPKSCIRGIRIARGDSWWTVLERIGYRRPVFRILIRDLNPAGVTKALGESRPNAKFRPLYQAALARQRSDWLCGVNLTRGYMALGRIGGYDGILSVGRVQTPLLALIVERGSGGRAVRSPFVPRPARAARVVRRVVPSAMDSPRRFWTTDHRRRAPACRPVVCG